MKDNCFTTKQDAHQSFVSGKKKGRGEENLFKRDGRKGGFLTIIG